jgi:hypothetical protein
MNQCLGKHDPHCSGSTSGIAMPQSKFLNDPPRLLKLTDASQI